MPGRKVQLSRPATAKPPAWTVRPGEVHDLGTVIGRRREAFDLLQALNTGHMGSLSTIHANSAEQALTRLAHCVLTANVGLPHRSVREAIALAIHLDCSRPGGISPDLRADRTDLRIEFDCVHVC